MDDCSCLLETRYCDLRKVEGLNEKADVARKFINEMFKLNTEMVSTHFIEDRLAGFSGGGSNAGTIMRLAAFNAIVSWMIHDKWRAGGKIEMMHPSTVKAMMRQQGLDIPKGADKKKLTMEYVAKREPEKFKIELNRNDNPQPYCFDMADACITAWAGFRKYLHPCK